MIRVFHDTRIDKKLKFMNFFKCDKFWLFNSEHFGQNELAKLVRGSSTDLLPLERLFCEADRGF